MIALLEWAPRQANERRSAVQMEEDRILQMRVCRVRLRRGERTPELLVRRRVDRALRESFPEAKLLLQVHDELIVECPEDQAPQVAALVSREMENVAQLKVPLTAEAKFGKSWYDAK